MRSCAAVRLRHAIAAVATAVIALAAFTPQAFAEFPYVGDGTSGDPASWALAPGHVPSNLGGLGWKFAATPAIPPSNESQPAEYQAITQNNSQQDELCGVTGMSLVDAHATFPSGTGSCIAAGSPVKTAFEVSLGRPDVSIGELDSGILWNDAGAMTQLRKKVLINAGELPVPRVDLAKAFDPSRASAAKRRTPAPAATTTRAAGCPAANRAGAARFRMTSTARACSTRSPTRATRAWPTSSKATRGAPTHRRRKRVATAHPECSHPRI
jgi:hypothetical protein